MINMVTDNTWNLVIGGELPKIKKELNEEQKRRKSQKEKEFRERQNESKGR